MFRSSLVYNVTKKILRTLWTDIFTMAENGRQLKLTDRKMEGEKRSNRLVGILLCLFIHKVGLKTNHC